MELTWLARQAWLMSSLQCFGHAKRLFIRASIGRIVEAGYVDCFRRLHPLHTPSQSRWQRLDYIFASPAACDHLPVWRAFTDHHLWMMSEGPCSCSTGRELGVTAAVLLDPSDGSPRSAR